MVHRVCLVTHVYLVYTTRLPLQLQHFTYIYRLYGSRSHTPVTYTPRLPRLLRFCHARLLGYVHTRSTVCHTLDSPACVRLFTLLRCHTFGFWLPRSVTFTVCTYRFTGYVHGYRYVYVYTVVRVTFGYVTLRTPTRYGCSRCTVAVTLPVALRFGCTAHTTRVAVLLHTFGWLRLIYHTTYHAHVRLDSAVRLVLRLPTTHGYRLHAVAVGSRTVTWLRYVGLQFLRLPAVTRLRLRIPRLRFGCSPGYVWLLRVYYAFLRLHLRSHVTTLRLRSTHYRLHGWILPVTLVTFGFTTRTGYGYCRTVGFTHAHTHTVLPVAVLVLYGYAHAVHAPVYVLRLHTAATAHAHTLFPAVCGLRFTALVTYTVGLIYHIRLPRYRWLRFMRLPVGSTVPGYATHTQFLPHRWLHTVTGSGSFAVTFTRWITTHGYVCTVYTRTVLPVTAHAFYVTVTRLPVTYRFAVTRCRLVTVPHWFGYRFTHGYRFCGCYTHTHHRLPHVPHTLRSAVYRFTAYGLRCVLQFGSRAHYVAVTVAAGWFTQLHYYVLHFTRSVWFTLHLRLHTARLFTHFTHGYTRGSHAFTFVHLVAVTVGWLVARLFTVTLGSTVLRTCGLRLPAVAVTHPHVTGYGSPCRFATVWFCYVQLLFTLHGLLHTRVWVTRLHTRLRFALPGSRGLPRFYSYTPAGCYGSGYIPLPARVHIRFTVPFAAFYVCLRFCGFCRLPHGWVGYTAACRSVTFAWFPHTLPVHHAHTVYTYAHYRAVCPIPPHCGSLVPVAVTPGSYHTYVWFFYVHTFAVLPRLRTHGSGYVRLRLHYRSPRLPYIPRAVTHTPHAPRVHYGCWITACRGLRTLRCRITLLPLRLHTRLPTILLVTFYTLPCSSVTRFLPSTVPGYTFWFPAFYVLRLVYLPPRDYVRTTRTLHSSHGSATRLQVTRLRTPTVTHLCHTFLPPTGYLVTLPATAFWFGCCLHAFGRYTLPTFAIAVRFGWFCCRTPPFTLLPSILVRFYYIAVGFGWLPFTSWLVTFTVCTVLLPLPLILHAPARLDALLRIPTPALFSYLPHTRFTVTLRLHTAGLVVVGYWMLPVLVSVTRCSIPVTTFYRWFTPAAPLRLPTRLRLPTVTGLHPVVLVGYIPDTVYLTVAVPLFVHHITPALPHCLVQFGYTHAYTTPVTLPARGYCIAVCGLPRQLRLHVYTCGYVHTFGSVARRTARLHARAFTYRLLPRYLPYAFRLFCRTLPLVLWFALPTAAVLVYAVLIFRFTTVVAVYLPHTAVVTVPRRAYVAVLLPRFVARCYTRGYAFCHTARRCRLVRSWFWMRFHHSSPHTLPGYILLCHTAAYRVCTLPVRGYTPVPVGCRGLPRITHIAWLLLRLFATFVTRYILPVYAHTRFTGLFTRLRLLPLPLVTGYLRCVWFCSSALPTVTLFYSYRCHTYNTTHLTGATPHYARWFTRYRCAAVCYHFCTPVARTRYTHLRVVYAPHTRGLLPLPVTF